MADLIHLPLLGLTENPKTGEFASASAQPKHVQRLTELLVRKPLTNDVLEDLRSFPSLEDLYLEAGCDHPSTLAAIPKHLAASSVTVFVSTNELTGWKPPFQDIPSLESAELAAYGQEKLQAEDATSATFILNPSNKLPDLSKWTRLHTVDITLKHGADTGDIALPPSVTFARLTWEEKDGHWKKWSLSTDQTAWTAGKFSATFGQTLLGTKVLTIAGDGSAFRHLHGHSVPKINGNLSGLTEAQFEVNATAGVKNFVKQIPSLNELTIQIDGKTSKRAIERLVDSIIRPGLKILVNYQEEFPYASEFSSETRTWTTVNIR